MRQVCARSALRGREVRYEMVMCEEGEKLGKYDVNGMLRQGRGLQTHAVCRCDVVGQVQSSRKERTTTLRHVINKLNDESRQSENASTDVR